MSDVRLGYRYDLEDREAIFSRGQPIYRQWRALADEVTWPAPDEIDPRGWFAIDNQGNQGSCFPAGTMVTMADGSLRPIEKVNYGEEVITHAGNSRAVTDTMSRLYSGNLHRVFVKGWGEILATHDHPFLTRDRGWVKAEDLELSDRVLISSFTSHDPAVDIVDVADYLSGRYFLEDSSVTVMGCVGSTPRWIELDYDACFLIGLWAAEGSIDRSGSTPLRSVWTLNQNEQDLIGKIQSFACRLGLKCSVARRSGSKAVNVRIQSSPLAQFFLNSVGSGANRKQVPAFILSGRDGQKEAFLRGWFAGDGTKTRCRDSARVSGAGVAVASRQVSACTASRVMASQCASLLISLGKKAGRSMTAARSHQRYPSYSVYLYGDDACWISGVDVKSSRKGKREHELCDSGEWRRIRSIDLTHVSNLKVYDLTVEHDHSFLAEGVAVHNCQGHALADSAEYCHWLHTGEFVQLSRGFSYLESQRFDGIGGDQGSTLDGGTKAILGGIPLESVFPYDENYSSLKSRYQRQRAEILADPTKLYRLDGEVPLKSERDCFQFISTYSGIIQIGILWGLPDTWEITSWSPSGGGHSVTLAGYLKMSAWGGYGYLLKNSWSTHWGRDGWALVHPKAIEQMLSHRFTVFIGRAGPKTPIPKPGGDL